MVFPGSGYSGAPASSGGGFPGLPEAQSGPPLGSPWPDPAAAGSLFGPPQGGDIGTANPSSSPVRPLYLLLALAVLTPVLASGLLLLEGWGWNVLGWAVSVFGGLGLLAAFTLTDTRRRADPWYEHRDGLVSALRVAVLVLALAAAAAHAWYFADWFSRLEIFAA